MKPPAGSTPAPANRDVRGLALALGVYGVVFGLKLAVYLNTGVLALLAEALHTLSDILISAFLLVALVWSRKAADERYAFGYGRAQNAAALVAATLFISFTSYQLYAEAIPRLLRPVPLTYGNLPLAVGIIVASMILAGAPLAFLLRGSVTGAAAKAQLSELVNDELGLLAALAGTLLIGWGWPVADPIATLIVATAIALNAAGLLREHASLLIGRSPAPEVLRRVESLALSVDGVLGVHDIRAEFAGPDVLHVGMHIAVRRGTPIEVADHIAHEVEGRIHQDVRSAFCVIHVDPEQEVVQPARAA